MSSSVMDSPTGVAGVIGVRGDSGGADEERLRVGEGRLSKLSEVRTALAAVVVLSEAVDVLDRKA